MRSLGKDGSGKERDGPCEGKGGGEINWETEREWRTRNLQLIILRAGLEAQLLGIVVRKEKPQLEEQKDNLVRTISNNKRTLKELEDRILQ